MRVRRQTQMAFFDLETIENEGYQKGEAYCASGLSLKEEEEGEGEGEKAKT